MSPQHADGPVPAAQQRSTTPQRDSGPERPEPRRTGGERQWLQRAAGNSALTPTGGSPHLSRGRVVASPLLRAYLTGQAARAAHLAISGIGTGHPLPDAVLETARERLGTDLTGVRAHTDDVADRRAADLGATAFAVGNDVVVRREEYRPASTAGRDLLLHELAHVAQHRAVRTTGPEAALEQAADRAAHGSVAPPAGRCTGVTIHLPGTIIFHGTRGDIVAALRMVRPLPPGSYTLTYQPAVDELEINAGGAGLLVEVTLNVAGTESQMKRAVDGYKAYLVSMTKPVHLEVLAEGGAGGGSGGTGEGPAGASAEDRPTPAEAGGGTRSDDPRARPDGDPAAVPGAGTSPKTGLEDAKGPVVEVTSIAQVEELKKRGMIPVAVADTVADKLGKHELLPFEEAVALLDAMNTLIAPATTDQPPTGEKKTSWVEWARFIRENRDKLSGRTTAGEKGLTPEDVKAILAKHKEYVGVQATPTMTIDEKLRQKEHDPAVRKSWNSLQDWERELWNEYRKKHGGPVESDRTDLSITADDRFAMALRMSPDYLDEGRRDAARAMFNDPVFIASTLAGIAVYLALWALPEPVFSKAAAVLTTIALASLVAFSVTELANLAQAWMALGDETRNARTMKELEAAAERFGRRIGAAELRILLALAMIVVGKLIPKPTPMPSGGGGGMATAGGPPGVLAAPAAVGTVKVVNGVIVVVGAPPGLIMAAASGSGGGGGGGGPKDPPAKAAETPDPKKKPRELTDDEKWAQHEKAVRDQQAAAARSSGPVVEKYTTAEAAIGQLEGTAQLVKQVPTINAGLRNQGFTETWYVVDSRGTQWTVARNPRTGEFTGAHPSSSN